MNIEKHYRKHRSLYVKYALARLRSTPHLAEDAVQEAYLRAIKYRNSFNSERQNFNAYFSRILDNCIKDISKLERTRGASDVDVETICAKDTEIELATSLADFIEEQNETNREVLSLYYHLCFNSKEISQIVNKSHVAVRVYLTRFRQAFRERYGLTTAD